VCLYCFYSLFSFLVMFYSYHIDVQLSHLNKYYLLTYLVLANRLVGLHFMKHSEAHF